MTSKEIVKKISKLTWEPHDLPMTPHLIFSFLDAGIRQLKNILGDSYYYFLVYIKENNGRFGFTEEDLLRLGELTLKKARREKSFLKQIEERWNRDKKGFIQVTRKIDKTDLSQLSIRQLLYLYNRFYKSYVLEYTVPTMANAVDFCTQKEIKNKLESIVKGEKERIRCLTIINSPVQASFSNIERSNLLNIISVIKCNKKLLNIFKKESPENINLQINDFSEIHKLIRNHAKKYFWLLNNYAQTVVLDELHFIKKIKDIILTSSDPLQEIKEVESGLKKIKNSKKQLIQKLKLNKDVRLLIRLQEASISWRDERKMYNQIADHYHMLFLKEASRRFALSLNELMYTLPEEFVSLLNGRKINRDILRKRKEACLIIGTLTKSYIITGPEATRINKKVYKVKDLTEGALMGLVASLGEAKGVVRIIMTPSDFKKMKKGDILVTSMTRPEFVPIMKLASAIVTDEGGVTCHAAILSRELKTPCVIGTKIATSVLKDGDLVEVNADKGVIKILKKK